MVDVYSRAALIIGPAETVLEVVDFGRGKRIILFSYYAHSAGVFKSAFEGSI